MDIYWIKDKRQCGPSTVPDVISLVQMGELTPDTLGWHAGCRQWLPLRELPALADFLNKDSRLESETEEVQMAPHSGEADEAPLPSAPEPEATSGGDEDEPLPPVSPVSTPSSSSPAEHGSAAQRVYLPSPLTRLMARFVDYGLYVAAFYGVLYLRQVPYDVTLLLSVNPLLWMPMVAIEALLLSIWGTTPGKALMGIRMSTFGDAPNLGFLRAFMRSLMVFTLGMGVMMPQLLPVMLAFSYWMLRRRGITPWDARCSTLPTRKAPVLPSRYVLAVISLYICVVLAGSCVQGWFPAILADVEKQSPELAQKLRHYMPLVQPEGKRPAPDMPATQAGSSTSATPAPPAVPAPNDTSLPGI